MTEVGGSDVSECFTKRLGEQALRFGENRLLLIYVSLKTPEALQKLKEELGYIAFSYSDELKDDDIEPESVTLPNGQVRLPKDSG